MHRKYRHILTGKLDKSAIYRMSPEEKQDFLNFAEQYYINKIEKEIYKED